MPDLDQKFEDFTKGYAVRFYIGRATEQANWRVLEARIKEAGMTLHTAFDVPMQILFVYRHANGELTNDPTDRTSSPAAE